MSMAVTNNFSMDRIIYLCKRYIAIKKNMIFIGLAAMASIIVFIKAVLIYLGDGSHNLAPAILSLAFVIFQYAGYAFTSTMFNELNSAGSAPQFYTLPATTFEKISAAWLISYVGYTLVGLTALYILSLLSGMEAGWFFSLNTFTELWIYTIFQSIFLFGAVYFKANNFLSTIVAMLGLMISLGLIYFLLEHIHVFDSMKTWTFSIPTTLLASTTTHIISSIVFTVILTSLFIWFAYLRLKNRQIA